MKDKVHEAMGSVNMLIPEIILDPVESLEGVHAVLIGAVAVALATALAQIVGQRHEWRSCNVSITGDCALPATHTLIRELHPAYALMTNS